MKLINIKRLGVTWHSILNNNYDLDDKKLLLKT